MGADSVIGERLALDFSARRLGDLQCALTFGSDSVDDLAAGGDAAWIGV